MYTKNGLHIIFTKFFFSQKFFLYERKFICFSKKNKDYIV